MEAFKSLNNSLKTRLNGFSFEKQKHEIITVVAVAIVSIAILVMILTVHNKFPMTKCSSGVDNLVPNYILAGVVTVAALFVLRLNYKSKTLGNSAKAFQHGKDGLSYSSRGKTRPILHQIALPIKNLNTTFINI
jgi:hypothetical protein